jgi:F-type H+-transporting ATPase subunit alpha
MANFKDYLDKFGEVGEAEQVVGPIVYARGLPQAKPVEMIIAETGELGQVISLSEDYVEILMFSQSHVKAGTRLARMGSVLQVPVGEAVLGHTLTALGQSLSGNMGSLTEWRPVDIQPEGMVTRESVEMPFESGISLVDLVIPLGKGQRELVIGDRKTGKAAFLQQVVLNQAQRGTVCIYAGIGLKQQDIDNLESYFKAMGIEKNTVLVASNASDPSGIIFLAPYTAMTLAESFRDAGRDVLVILDDLTSHAKTYREISLLARRFPGRNSYPGDVFYLHSRLLERAGNFKQGSITCLPVAESTLGDITGYIQTNLMSMTDGHIYFDNDLYDSGRRPAINPLVSVTRVGLQTQTGLLRDASRVLTGFIVENERLRQYLHFGAELSEEVRLKLDLGERVQAFLNQSAQELVPTAMSLLLLAGLWSGIWRSIGVDQMKDQQQALVERYRTDAGYQQEVNKLIGSVKTFDELLNLIKRGTPAFEK